MDLIGSIASATGVPEAGARALAGAVLGTVREKVGERSGPAEARAMEQAVPELGGWLEQAKGMLGGGPVPAAGKAAPAGGLLGGLLGAAGSGIGNDLLGAVAGKDAQQAATVVALAGKLGISADQAMLAAPLVLSFLKSRMPPDWVDKALAAAPILAGGAGSPAAGALGALGGLFGKKG